ncbi:MAG: universal stress protein, partial [Chloroflexi bacterium]|nr:universal stress protein [Chloroflexota bacterium]
MSDKHESREVIVCATRGGEGSRAAQEKAIRRAQETGGRLIFIYVVDFNVLDHFDGGLKPAVRHELSWLGKTLLSMAKKRAEDENVPVQVVVREGAVGEEIIKFLRDSGAGVLFLGASRSATSTFSGDDAVEQLARAIGEKAGIPVEVVRPA